MARTLLLPSLLLGLAPALPAQEPPGEGDLPDLDLEPAFDALRFERPVFLTWAGEDDDLLYVADQAGRIHVFENRDDIRRSEVFLDIRDKVFEARDGGHNEEGLLSIVFHPRFEENRQLFVFYSASEDRGRHRRGVLARYTAPEDRRADPASEEILLEVEEPFGNHNGCCLLFGPDGFLYLSLGDGGAANDPLNAGQDLGTWLGKILRIDVDRSEGGRPYAVPAGNPFAGREDALPEIWAWGLRNVWRMSFDRETGDLWAGDVGQNKWEEIDLIMRGGNYGWRIREGFHPFSGEEPKTELLDPVLEYSHAQGLSVTGGYVYRGQAIPSLRGAYLYGDYQTRRIWALRWDGSKVTAHKQVVPPSRSTYVASFAEDADGEIYLCGFDNPRQWTGRLFRLVERKAAAGR